MKYYLYTPKDIPKLFEYYGHYSHELYRAFKTHRFRTLNPHEADLFITCFSNEWHYLMKGKKLWDLKATLQAQGKPKQEINLEQIQHVCKYVESGPHITFYHSDTEPSHDNFTNIPYCTFNKNKIIIPPPPLLDLNRYMKNKTRNTTVSFKGQLTRPDHYGIDHRGNILTHIRTCYPEATIESPFPSRRDYGDLLGDSLFGLVIEGDLPWSYRLCEVINSGAIPLIILSNLQDPTGATIHTLPGHDHLSYDNFSYTIKQHEIKHFFTNTIHDILSNPGKIQKMQDHLSHVNKNVFFDVPTHVNFLLQQIRTKIK